MRVFHIPDRNQTHHEGFVGMPPVIKKQIFDGKMDMLFAHAGNLHEATPEFIPTMKRLASRFRNVKAQLADNPYVDFQDKIISNLDQMKIGVKRGFKGSSIGNLLREEGCTEEAMMVALLGARDLMDSHSNHHHYHDIINNRFVTKNILQYILKNIPFADVQENAVKRLTGFVQVKLPSQPSTKELRMEQAKIEADKAKKIQLKIERVKKMKIKIIKRGKAKIRVTA
jgi:hypothetical protein